MPIRSETVRSVPEFIQVASQIRTRWNSDDDSYFDPWFRGQSNAAWNLVPTYYRRKLEIVYEGEMRGEFIRRGVQLPGAPASSAFWEWYFLQQHYRCPTRLLDWTDSALVALFFALNSNPPSEVKVKSDAAVWVLDPWWLNQQSIGRDSVVNSDWPEAKPYLPTLFTDEKLRKRFPIAIDPPHIDRRLAVQRSRFTIHGREEEGLHTLGRRPRSRLIRIVIKKSAVNDMRLDLATCGITDAVLFPDLEGLSRELERFDQAEWTPI